MMPSEGNFLKYSRTTATIEELSVISRMNNGQSLERAASSIIIPDIHIEDLEDEDLLERKDLY